MLIALFVEQTSTEIGGIRYLHLLSGAVSDPDALSPYRHVQDDPFTIDIGGVQTVAVSIGVAPSVRQLIGSLGAYAGVDRRLLMRGHDITAIISLAAQKCGRSCGLKRIEQSLRTGFEQTDLQATNSILRSELGKRIEYRTVFLRSAFLSTLNILKLGRFHVPPLPCSGQVQRPTKAARHNLRPAQPYP